MMAISISRYSGNKARMLPHYRRPPPGTLRVVEPYLGSGAYVLNSGLPGLGFDTDSRVVALWRWFHTVGSEEIQSLEDILARARATTTKPDIRDLPISEGARLYLKLNVCSAMVGQWSSWKAYPQHRLPIKKTMAALSAARQIEVCHADASSYIEQQRAGDMAFLDPPYLGTHANYASDRGYHEKTLRLLERLTVPVLLTYGDGAPDIFSGLPWTAVKTRGVPNLRKGGTTNRTEYAAYLNWPQ